MALKKLVTIGGHTGEYWRIERFEVQNLVANFGGLVWVSLLVNANSAAPGTKPITMRSYKFPASVLSKADMVEKVGHDPVDPYKKLYAWLKTQADFAGALDA